MTRLLMAAITAFSLSGLLPGCARPEHQSEIRLETAGYGYEIGDIVLLDTRKEPEVGDIVQYNWATNKSNCLAMGPTFYLAKVIAVPGDNVTFGAGSYSANGQTVSYAAPAGVKPTMWGTLRYDSVADMRLAVPDGEYLADRWLGLECTGEIEGGSSKTYDRFTVKNEAITGVVLRKLGHDRKFEEEMRNRVY
jgi:hypothetical protein